MKRAVLIHGWGGHPDEGWRPWLKNELEKHGFEVLVPEMPETKSPTLHVWLSHLQKLVGTPDTDTYFVGHSLGCVTILRYLETLKPQEKVGGVLMVAGFGEDLSYLGYMKELKSFFETPIEWEKIKTHCSSFFALHSDDDTWVDKKNLELFKEKLDAKAVLQTGMKHYSGDDNVNELPIILEELLLMSDY